MILIVITSYRCHALQFAVLADGVVARNEIRSDGSAEVHFVKSHDDVVTMENIGQFIIISTLGRSPIETLYSEMRHVFGPALLADPSWAGKLDQKTHGLLQQLEKALGASLTSSRGQRSSDMDNMSGCRSLSDELAFWQSKVHSGSPDAACAATFVNALDLVAPRYVENASTNGRHVFAGCPIASPFMFGPWNIH